MTHRFFHYDPDSGRSTPVEPVKLPDGTEALVPLDVYKAVKREVYGMPETIAPESADAAIRDWEKEESDDR